METRRNGVWRGDADAGYRAFESLRIGRYILGGMKSRHVRLFVKPYCGWCHEAQEWLQERGIAHETLDVISDPTARREMMHLSGQTLAPVIDVDGEVLADFDTDQLASFWKRLEQSPG
jgi:glutaredoxin